MEFQKFRCRVEADVRRLGRAAKRFERLSDEELRLMASHLVHEFSVGVVMAFALEFFAIPEDFLEENAPCELACLHVVEGRGYVEGMGQLRTSWEGLGAMAGKWLLVCPACAGHIKAAIERGGMTLAARSPRC